MHIHYKSLHGGQYRLEKGQQKKVQDNIKPLYSSPFTYSYLPRSLHYSKSGSQRVVDAINPFLGGRLVAQCVCLFIQIIDLLIACI